MPRVLITGGAGFIGHHLAIAWRRKGAEVVILDNFRTGSRANLAAIERAVGPGSLTVIEGSITDSATTSAAAAGCAIVHHLAAQVSVPESVACPAESIALNVLGTLNVLEAARAAGSERLVFSSSCAVYGDDPRSPKTEDMAPAPLSPYGITKLDGEHYLKMYAQLRGLPCVSLRYFNVFGPRQDPKSVYAAAIPIFIQRAMRGEPITIYGDGDQTRDFVFVDDVAAANILAATSPDAGGGEVFNVAQGGRVTINDLVETVCRLTKSASPVIRADARAGDIKHSRASVEKITRQLGFHAQTSLEAGLRQCIDAVASQEA